MDFHYFDIVVGVIILLLGLKGILNGFFKELFGLIGIIGGIYIASRYGTEIGTMLSDMIFHFDNESAKTFTGFIVTLILFWTLMLLIGIVFKKISKESGLGPIDKFFGFIVGSGKFFLIAAVIFFALNNIKAVHSNLAPIMEKSILFPILIETGDIIMHIDPTEISSEIDASINEGADKIKTVTDEKVQEHAKELIDNVKANMQTESK
ncbi:MAG: CvpA family protein [Campylobacterota bacterium]|nr:CvpA family protein [Campylobacterota bacterium]